MDIIQSLEWRYAVKKFDPQKKISQSQLQGILGAVNLSASSYGMQPYKMVVISDSQVREKLREQAFDQTQITESSHLILFAPRTDLGKPYVEDTVNYMEQQRSLPHGALDGFKATVVKSLEALSPLERENWATKQSYIALGTLLTYCALQKIDACPIEGFVKEAFDKILNLSAQNVRSAVLAAVGYRALDDPFEKMKKVRKPLSEMVVHA